MKTGGVIGLGGIGGGVAQCLQRSGQLSAIYDVRPEAAERVPGGWRLYHQLQNLPPERP